MVYRNDVEALEIRYRALEAELAERTRARDEVGRMLAEAQARARDEVVVADLAAGGPQRRRRRRALVLGVFSAVVLIGIQIGHLLANHDHTDRVDRMMDRFAAFTDRICRCADAPCINKVTAEIGVWGAEIAREGPPLQPDEAATRRATKIGERMSACMMRTLSPDAGSRDQQGNQRTR